MSRDRSRQEVGDMRAVELGEELLARQLLEVGADGLDGIDLVAARARLGDRALRDLLAVRAPEVDLDAVLLLEGLRERPRLARRERGVEHHHAFAARGLGEALLAVGAAIQVERLVRRLGMRRRRTEQGERRDHGHTIGL